MQDIEEMSPIPAWLSPVICIGLDSISSALILESFWLLQIFLPTSKCRNPTICAQFCPLLLSVPETAMGVTLNAQQHSDSEYVQAIHRWEMGVCWGEYCVLLLAGCSLNCCSWPCAHTITVWVTAVSKCMAERGRLICHVEGWELIVLQLTAFWYKNIYS